MALSAVLGLAGPAVTIAAAAGDQAGAQAPLARAGTPGFDARALPALPAVAATPGPLVPSLQGVRLTGSQALSTTLTPTLVATGHPAGSQVRYEIRDLRGQLVWSTTTSSGTAVVPPGRLRQGASYTWSTRNDQQSPPYVMNVDVQRPAAQSLTGYGGLSVMQTTGEPTLSFASDPVQGIGGPIAVGLSYAPSNSLAVFRSPGVPAGWRVASGNGLAAMHRVAPGVLELTDGVGHTTTFQRASSGIWSPRFGPGQSWPAGTHLALVENPAARDFTVTARSGAVTVFPAPTATRATTYPSRVWASGEPTVEHAYDATGRVTSLTDPVSRRQVRVSYAPSDDCPTPTAAGLIAAPTGMLCRVTSWDGATMDVQYSGTPAAPRIARIITDSQADSTLISQTDLGWDASTGRLMSLRAPTTNAALAAGVLDGFGADDAVAPELLTTATYDARGRVVQVARPSAIASGQPRAQAPARGTRQISYGPEGTTTLRMPGRSRALSVITANPATMLPTREVDAHGRVTTTTWDTALQVVTERHFPGQRIERFAHDALGNVTSVTGPTTTPDSPTAPRIDYAYDTRVACPRAAAAEMATARTPARCTQTVRRTRAGGVKVLNAQSSAGSVTTPVVRPLEGLQATFWANRDFSAAPSLHATGPPVAGHVPKSLSVTWASSPVGSAAWAVRLQGTLRAPATGTYVLRTNTSARLWVGTTACRPTCSVALTAGRPQDMRIDLESGASGGAAVNVTWQGPSASGAVPMSALRPGYATPTQASTRDDLGSGGVRTLGSAFVLDPADPSRILETVSPSGLVNTRAYEAYDPATGRFGRATTGAMAPGRSMRTDYFAADEVAQAEGCDGATPAVQGGLASQVQLPGGLSTAQVYDAAGRVVSQSGNGVTTMCMSYDSAGNPTRTVAPGTSDAPESVQQSTPNAGDNPLAAVSTTTSDGVERRAEKVTDILGRTVVTRDAWGTVVTPVYDDMDRVVSSTAVTARGEQTTEQRTYTDDSQLQTVVVNGVTEATCTYTALGALAAVDYANGARLTVAYDQNGNVRERVLTAGGARMGEAVRTSPAGRIIARHITGPTTDAWWSYAYDLDGRLTSAVLSGRVPEGVATGTYRYALNAASQRTSITTPSGQVTYAYGESGRLESTSDPTFAAGFTYDDQGRATTAGPISLRYSATGQVLQMSQGGTSTRNILAGNAVIGAITTTDGVAREAHYTAAGMILRADGSLANQVVALPGGVTLQSGDSWQYQDGLGGAAWQATGGAAPTSTALFDPDGNRVGARPTPSTDPARPDYGWLAGSGLSTGPLAVATVQMGGRTYVPALGVFLQPDPKPGGGPTAYGYASGDPINGVDPAGQWTEYAAVAIRVAVATGVSVAIMYASGGTGATVAASFLKGAVWGAVAGAAGDTAGQGSEILFRALVLDEHTEMDFESIGIAAASGAAAEGVGLAFSAWKDGLPFYRAAAGNLDNGAAQIMPADLLNNSQISYYTADDIIEEGAHNITVRSRLSSVTGSIDQPQAVTQQVGRKPTFDYDEYAREQLGEEFWKEMQLETRFQDFQKVQQGDLLYEYV